MIAFAFYLLKVFVCSGILALYYLVALKDKAFHQWNRFYLLSAVALSIALPLVQIIVATTAEKTAAIQLIQVVQSADDYMEAITISSRPHISTEQWLTTGYAFASLILLTAAIFSLVKIHRLAKKWGIQRVEGIRFINTADPRTPFSFWRSVFWNREIPLDSEAGRQIFQHELVHIREKHTLDALFLQAVMVVFWCNPSFWLIKKELRFLHEFIADKQSVGEAGTAAFATMILQAAYPSQYSSLVNPFFQKSIKRRLAMLTKMQNPRLNYTGRIVALPLIALVAFAFTLRTKETSKAVKLNKEFVVVIDAGHGKKDGHFTGANDGNVYEDELALTLAKKIGEFNTNPDIKIVFTRNDENIVDLKERVAIAQAAKADMLISIHLNALPPITESQRQSLPKEKLEGIQIFVPAGTSAFGVQSTVLGSSVSSEMSSFYKTNATLLTPKQSIYVLASAPCPAILIECGTITDETDKAFITSPNNQKNFAKHILSAIERYAVAREKDTGLRIDTLPKKQIESVDVNKAKGLLTVYYTDGSCETITKQEANNRGLATNGGQDNTTSKNPSSGNVGREINIKISTPKPTPLYVVDNIETSPEAANKLDPNSIASIDVLMADKASKFYGEKGKNGVVEITTKAYNSAKLSATPLYVVDGVEIDEKQKNSIDPTKIESMNVLKGPSAIAKYGTKGERGVIEIIMKKTSAKELGEIEVIGKPLAKNTLTPIVVEGKPLNTITSSDANQTRAIKPILNEVVVVGHPLGKEPVFEQTETPASVDKTEWRNFLSKNAQPIIDSMASKGVKSGTYIANVRFLVEKDGSLSDVKLLNDLGYGADEKIIAMMKSSPKWTPAQQNGKTVRSYHTQPITFMISNQ